MVVQSQPVEIQADTKPKRDRGGFAEDQADENGAHALEERRAAEADDQHLAEPADENAEPAAVEQSASVPSRSMSTPLGAIFRMK